MRKYRSYIFLILLLFGFLSIGYFLLGGKEKKVEIVEINFVSDHAIVSNSNETIPDFITTFAACYTENDSLDYISKISFKRLDINNLNADSLYYNKARIDKKLKVSEAEEMFKAENYNKPSTKHMSANTLGNKTGLKKDTSGIRYFYLVSNFDPTTMNSAIHFEQPEELKEHINQELKSGTLFKGKKENKVTIIILKGNSSNPVGSPNQDPEPKPVPHEHDGGGGPVAVPKDSGPVPPKKTSEKPPMIDSDNDGISDSKDNCPNEYGVSNNKGCPIKIDVKLKKPNATGDNANLVSWNPELKNRKNYRLTLKLTLQSTNSIYFEEDVTGLSSYIVPDEAITGYNNKKTIVTLEVQPLADYIEILNNVKLTNMKFFCKTPE